jgi:hypothetical protein
MALRLSSRFLVAIPDRDFCCALAAFVLLACQALQFKSQPFHQRGQLVEIGMRDAQLPHIFFRALQRQLRAPLARGVHVGRRPTGAHDVAEPQPQIYFFQHGVQQEVAIRSVPQIDGILQTHIAAPRCSTMLVPRLL